MSLNGLLTLIDLIKGYTLKIIYTSR